ncbi:MAG: CoA transferase [Actinomycetota bacterium]|jgi:hypothetical protein
MTWELDASNVGTGLPLEGVRVLDLSRVLAGPLCAMVAGDLGADVIKVEGPSGDPVRQLAPPRFGADATYYLAVNRHRRNIVADLRDPRDFARVLELVAAADAVVENYLPSQFRDLNIATLRQANPDCVWVSISSASSTGPLADSPSFDLLAQARSGLMSVTGTSDGAPTKVGAPIADVVAGLYAAVGLVTGLFARVSGRPGRHFEAPLLESAMSALVNQAQGYLVNGVNPGRLGNDHPSITPYGPVRTADGWLMLAVGTDGQFEKLRAVISDSVVSEKRFDLNDDRVAAREELGKNLERVFSARGTGEWLIELADSGVPHAPILDLAGAFSQPQISNGDFIQLTSAPAGSLRQMATPLLVDGVRPKIRRGPQALGADGSLN